jgi:hypothetical protein
MSLGSSWHPVSSGRLRPEYVWCALCRHDSKQITALSSWWSNLPNLLSTMSIRPHGLWPRDVTASLTSLHSCFSQAKRLHFHRIKEHTHLSVLRNATREFINTLFSFLERSYSKPQTTSQANGTLSVTGQVTHNSILRFSQPECQLSSFRGAFVICFFLSTKNSRAHH